MHEYIRLGQTIYSVLVLETIILCKQRIRDSYINKALFYEVWGD